MKTLNRIIFAFLFSIILLPYSFAKTKEDNIQVTITGVNTDLETNIRDNLSLLRESVDDESLVQDNEQISMRARQEIITALQPFGYYHADVQSNIEQVDGKIKATFNINLGPAIHVNAIHFNLIGEGEKDPALYGLMQLFPLKNGDVFVHESYEQGKKALLSKTIQSGYLNAMFSEHRVEVDIDNNTSVITLTLATGPRHFFGEVSFGKTELSDKLLNRYLPFQPGDIYSPEKIMILQSRLNQSDYFSSVNVKALTEDQSTKVPVVVELEDAKPNQYILGAGYGTDTGVRGKLGWTRRRLNSLGHRFSATAQLAEIYNRIHLDYIIPGKQPATDQIKLQAGIFEDEFSEKPSHIYETGIIEEREISGWQRRLSVNYHHERFNAFITNDVIQSKLILPSITFVQIKRHELDNSPSGRRIELTMRGSIDALFSDTTFFQTYLQLKWVHAFNEATRLLVRGDFGFTVPDDSENLPLSQRFFAGGDQSLRGYGYRSLPDEIDKDGNRLPVGGSYLTVGSLELAHTVKKPFGVFAFVDAGNAYRELFVETEIGTGVGIEWQTKLGPIKFAIAKPLTKPADSWRIHASFGPEL